MSKYQVVISHPARQDVIDLARYIASDLSAPDAASNLVDQLEEGMKSLGNNPKRQKIVRDDYLASKGYRVLPVKNYLIFYKVFDKENRVDIIRILYKRRDWINLLY